MTMRAVVDAGDLADAMREVTHGMALTKPTMPALRSVLLEVRGGRLRVVAGTLGARPRWSRKRNGERVLVEGLEAECRGRDIEARIAVDGELLVPAKLMADLARDLKGFGGMVLLEGRTRTETGYTYTTSQFKRVEVTREVLELEVRCQRFNFVAHVSGLEAAQYPAIWRDIDLGDWALMAPAVAAMVAA